VIIYRQVIKRQMITTGKITSRLVFLKRFSYILVLSLIFFSCKKDIEYINALSNEIILPTQTGKNFEVQYTDSCKLQAIFKAPLVERYTKGAEDAPYYEFTQGIELYFFDRNEELESILTARYAKYWEDKSLGMARDSVVGRNVKTGEQLNTEELYWDREKRLIYSNVFTKVTNADGVFFGEKGFEADQGFQHYKLIGSSGTVRVSDENKP
jgi:LPS export ABC transporter protein LptC